MTSLLPRPTSTSGARGRPDPADLRHRRPLLLVASAGGLAAAAAPLLLCLGVGVVGWFLSDAGVHGTPRDGLRVGALAWLMAHHSGVSVGGAAVSVTPLALTLLCAWATWRLGHRVGDSVSGHGPDADRIADGERDWTVPLAAAAFGFGYLLVALVTARLAGSGTPGVSATHVVSWALLLCALLGGTAIAVGSGRAAIWATYLPAGVRAGFATCLRVLTTYVLASGLVLLGALVLDGGAAVNMLSQLHTDAGDSALLVLVMVAVVPNAVLLSGAYLLGPGFAVGTHTLVSPGLVVLGPLPMFPLLAALPEEGTPPGWVSAAVALPAVLAMIGVVRAQRRTPTLRWDEGALRGCVGGVLAGVVLAVVTSLAGGAAGPGRMRDVGAPAFEVLLHAITSFGLGGLVGGLLMTAWQRHRARRATDPA